MNYPRYLFSCGCDIDHFVKKYAAGCRMTCPEHIGASLEWKIVQCLNCGLIRKVHPKSSRRCPGCDADYTRRREVEDIFNMGNPATSVFHKKNVSPVLNIENYDRCPCLICPLGSGAKIGVACDCCEHRIKYDNAVTFKFNNW